MVGQGLGLTATGVAIGLLGAAGLTRLFAGMLYGVEPTDPLTLAAVSALVMLVALAACVLPARRAARVDARGALAGG